MAALEEHVATVWVVALLLLPYISVEEPLLREGLLPSAPIQPAVSAEITTDIVQGH